MSLTIREIKDNCLRARHLMQRTRAQKFAVGAFNIDNQDTLIAVARAASKLHAPVLVQVSHSEAKVLGMSNIRDMVDNYKREYGIEIYLNLDHAPSIEDCIKAIDFGFEFVHIDISQADHDASEDDIIDATKQVVDYARFTGAIVESEPHYFAGGSNFFDKDIDYDEIKKTFSTPEGAAYFVQKTGVDIFAAAVGNLHGKYKVPKQLDLGLLAKIRESVDCDISLHGGSGTPIHFYSEAAEIGVSKININSDMRIAFRKGLEKVLEDNPDEYAVIKLMDKVKDQIQQVVEDKIMAFGSQNKAVI
jgi:fructose-bisphosphate aldolase class II